ncbi:drug/metabolite transporter (DMT)-like permease [Neorhizobium huautlense]|uniref:Drug/metabolite transporter (DMT)-like permease n=1 Tax=Neorhizobium huautlense TaxID=67774 RepID=A0ABT9PWZ9_9HYPH|nr:DMT family transporter [Neorhizobium huautlense]MDP9838997.1 drug/metabolite transporter (DMT)-like permease [Neorhizobium huautlense]
MLDRLAPAVFVFLWSTGWIVAKYAAVHADPITFLAARHALAAIAFAGVALAMGAAWPKTGQQLGRTLFSGIFLHGLYLAGLWYAIGQGVPAGLSGVIAGLQPLLTAMLAPLFLSERLGGVQKIGLGLGFAGILIAIAPQFLDVAEHGLSGLALPVLINLVAMFSVTYGTLYQKRHLQEGDLLSIACLQYVGALLVTIPLALLLEDLRFDWTMQAIAAMVWSVIGLSMGAVGLLLYLIRRGQVSRAASLIYLMPPTVAIEAAILFGEPLTAPMVIGTIVVVAGVWMVNRKRAKGEARPAAAQ